MSTPSLDTSNLPQFSTLEPEQVVPALSKMLDDNRRELKQLLDNECGANFSGLVLPLEEMEHRLSVAWSPVSHLQGVIGSTDWREAYEQVLPMLTEYGTELAQNHDLQKAFEKLKHSLSDSASDAQRSLVDKALREFHLAGVDLDEDAKRRFRDIMRELAAVQAAFSNNVQDDSDAWSYVAMAEELDGLPDDVVQRARQAGDGDNYRLSLDYPTYYAVTTHAANRSLRETFYRAWSTRASDVNDRPQFDNSANIRRILELRAEAASIVGFENYAEFSLARKMAESADQVTGFLRKLAQQSRAAAERELDLLENAAGYPLEAWDLSYWLEQYKQQTFAIANETLRQYFPIDPVLNGLFDIASRLYGIKLRQLDRIDTWNDDVLFFEVSTADGEAIGGFYADLFARSGKRTGAWIDECVSRKAINGDAVLPVGYLVCNFAPRDEAGNSLLSHTDIVTLFHEFGHMLHHLLTRIDYPSIAGINGVPWDAVELPSQFMENFAWSFEVLERCSRHIDTGEPLPRDLFDRLQSSRHAGAALAMLRQIEFALFDFRLHSEYDGPGFDVLALLKAVRDEVSVVPHGDQHRFPHAFTHIFAGGYAAGYYSYKWAEVLAADAFSAFEENGLFDRETAERFRREILEIGGSRDFMQAYVRFRGRQPSTDALLRQSGISPE